MKSRAALDWVNFLLADVQGGVGPFLANYLWSSQHWDAGRIGLIMTIAGIATVAARAPAGALVDSTTWKRGLIVGCASLVAAGAMALSLVPQFWPVAAAQTVIGAPTRYSRRRLRRSVSGLSVDAPSLGASAATRPSITLATHSRRSWQASPAI